MELVVAYLDVFIIVGFAQLFYKPFLYILNDYSIIPTNYHVKYLFHILYDRFLLYLFWVLL